MQDKHAALFQYPQAFQQQGMLVRTHNVMIDIVADHSIKAPVRKIQLVGIAVDKAALLTDTLGRRILLAQCLAVVVHRTPIIKAGDLRLRPCQCRTDRQRTGAAADFQQASVTVKVKAAQNCLMHLFHHAAFAEGVLAADPRHPAQQCHQNHGGCGEHNAQNRDAEYGKRQCSQHQRHQRNSPKNIEDRI